MYHRRLDVVDPGHRHPERGSEDRGCHAVEAFGRHADDGVGATADPQRPPDRARILVEPLEPERGRNHHDRRGAGTVVVRRQHAAMRGGNPEHLRVVARDGFAGYHPGSITGPDRPRHWGVAHQAGERPDAAAQVQVVGIRASVPREAVAAARVDVHELLRSIDRQPPQEGGVEQREEGGVEADPDGERDDGDRRQRRVLPDQPQRERDVLPEVVELADSPALPAVFLDRVQLAELESRAPARRRQ